MNAATSAPTSGKPNVAEKVGQAPPYALPNLLVKTHQEIALPYVPVSQHMTTSRDEGGSEPDRSFLYSL